MKRWLANRGAITMARTKIDKGSSTEAKQPGHRYVVDHQGVQGGGHGGVQCDR